MRSAPFLSGGRHLRPERSPFPRVAHAAHSGLLAPGGPWRCHTQASANVKSTHARPRAPARPRRTEARPLVSPSSCALGWLGDPGRGWLMVPAERAPCVSPFSACMSGSPRLGPRPPRRECPPHTAPAAAVPWGPRLLPKSRWVLLSRSLETLVFLPNTLMFRP